VAVVTAVAVAAVPMAAEVAGVSMAVADLIAARGPMAENGATKAAVLVEDQPRVITEWAAVRTAGLGPEPAAIRSTVIRRIFVPQSTMASGIRSAARRVSPAEPSEARQALVVAMVGVAAMVGAEAGAVAVAGVGEVGALALDGRTGAGGSLGILGGTTLTGTRRGRHLTTTRIMAMTGLIIRRPTGRIRRLTTTRTQATQARQARTMATSISTLARA